MTDHDLIFEDITPKEVPVQIAGEHYVLREATEATVTTYRDSAAKCMSMDAKDTKTITGSVTGANALLVSLCLFDSGNILVPVETIRSWPARVVKPLFEKAYEMAGLKDDEDDDDTAKNSPGDTMAGYV